MSLGTKARSRSASRTYSPRASAETNPTPVHNQYPADPIRTRRCEDHKDVVDFLPCPNCSAFFSAVNSFGSPLAVDQEPTRVLSSRDDEHIMAVGISQGWDKVRGHTGFDEKWEQFATFDAHLASMLRPQERLSTYIARLWYVYSIAPTGERDLDVLPKFLHPMPAQGEVKHDEVIDISPFPAFRQKLVLGQHKYRSDNFYVRYVEDFRFVWPHDIEDAWVHKSEPDSYEFSPLFREALYSPNCYSMLSDFFDVFPELHGDAQKYEPQLSVHRSRMMLRGAGDPSPRPRKRRRRGSRRVSSEEVLVNSTHTASSKVVEISVSSDSVFSEESHDPAEYLLNGLLSVLRHNDSTDINQLLHSFRTGGEQNIALSLQQNFTHLQERGVIPVDGVDGGDFLTLAGHVAHDSLPFQRPDAAEADVEEIASVLSSAKEEDGG